MNTIIAALGRRRCAFHSAERRSDRRRLPQFVDRPEKSRPANPRRRPGDAGHAERRQDVEQLVQPADRPILSRLDRQPVSVPDLRRAAGFGRGGGAEPQRQPVDGINMTQFHEVTAGGESDEIAPDPARSGYCLWRPCRPARPQVGADAQRQPDARLSRRIPRRMDAPADLGQARRMRSISATSASCAPRDGGRTWTADQPRPDARRSWRPGDARPADGERHRGARARGAASSTTLGRRR